MAYNSIQNDETPMETTLLLKQEAFVYKIPPGQTGSTGYKATSWNLDKPEWQGKLRLVSTGKTCQIRLEERAKGTLYAQVPVEAYPGPAVQTVSDSSRYFVIRVQDDSGRNAHLGLGFADRSDSFDLNVALQDHFKSVRVEEAIQNEEPKEKLDLAFKEGQTIKVSINIPRKSGRERSRSPATRPGGGIAPPPSAASVGNAMEAAGIQVTGPKIAAPPQKPAHSNWIQF